MRRPKGVRFWTCADVEAWIAANVPVTDRECAASAAIWWEACLQAEEIQECYRRKDLAVLLVDGVRKLRRSDVSGRLRCFHDNALDEGCKDGDLRVERSLRKHFGMKEV